MEVKHLALHKQPVREGPFYQSISPKVRITTILPSNAKVAVILKYSLMSRPPRRNHGAQTPAHPAPALIWANVHASLITRQR